MNGGIRVLGITPLFIRTVCTYKGITLAELYKLLKLEQYFTLSYLYKVVQEIKPVTDNLNKIINDSINEVFTTKDIIKVLKIQECLK